MRDWREYVSERLALPGVRRPREEKIVEDVARQLEDFFREGMSRGMSETEADAFALKQVRDWSCLVSDLLREERPNRVSTVERLAEPSGRKMTGGVKMLSELRQDLAFALRILQKNLGYATAAILTLALGIGSVLAVFSFIHAALFRPLPFPDPDRLLFVWEKTEEGRFTSPTYPNMWEWREHTSNFTGFTGMIAQSVNLTGDDEPTRVRGGFVSDSFFEVVGVPAMLGRTFRPGDEKPGTELFVVLNHPVWKVRYGGDPDILEQRIVLNGETYTVIGVMPEGFDFPIDSVEVWMPMHRSTNPVDRPSSRAWWNLARLRPGVSREQGQSELESTIPALEEKYPEINQGMGVELETLQSFLTSRDRQPLFLFLGAVALVLLIACANVANLMLGRAAHREREFALRRALGAARSRLVRQLLAEAGVLAFFGSLLGLLFSFAGVDILTAAAGGMLNGQSVVLDTTVITFVIALMALTALLFGLVPAWKFSQPDLIGTLREGATGAPRSSRMIGNALVVAQVALALVLLFGAGLLLRSFAGLKSIDPGFRTENLLTLEYRLPQNKYPEESQRKILHQQVVEKVRAVPGVISAAYFKRIPFSFNRSMVRFTLPGRPAPAEGNEPRSFLNTVSVGAFETMGIPVRRGRTFKQSDADGPLVVVINETFAGRYWPDSDPVGQRIEYPDIGATATVIGVVGNVKYLRLDEDAIPQTYATLSQNATTFATLAIRTQGDPMSYVRSVQEAVWSADPDQPMWKFRTAQSLLDNSLSGRQLNLGVLGGFALAALILAGIGLYGVIAYNVSQRTHEMGLRMALGARRNQIFGLVLRQGLVLTSFGLLLGALGSLALARVLASQLFGVTTTDVPTLLSVSVLLVMVAAAACYFPARRATQVDPMVALRYE